MSGDVIELGDSQTLRVRRSTPDVLELTSTWEPSAKPPPMHWHPSQRERFEIFGGELTVELGGKPARVFTEGDVCLIGKINGHLDALPVVIWTVEKWSDGRTMNGHLDGAGVHVRTLPWG